MVRNRECAAADRVPTVISPVGKAAVGFASSAAGFSPPEVSARRQEPVGDGFCLHFQSALRTAELAEVVAVSAGIFRAMEITTSWLPMRCHC